MPWVNVSTGGSGRAVAANTYTVSPAAIATSPRHPTTCTRNFDDLLEEALTVHGLPLRIT
jgi:hypothetical protein